MRSRVNCSRAAAHFCCYLSQTVRVTLKFSRRNGRSRNKIPKKTIVLAHFSSLVTPAPPGDPPPRGTLPAQRSPRDPPDSPRDFPWRFPEPPRDLDGRKYPKNYEIGLNGFAMSPHGLIFDEDEATGCPMPLEPFPTPFRLVLGPF